MINQFMVSKMKHYFNYLSNLTLGQIWNVSKCKLSPKSSYLKYTPLTLTLYISDKCTLSCNMCLQHSTSAKVETAYSKYYHKPCSDMTFETFKTIINMFESSITITLAGVGEPFLNNDFFDMVKYASINKKVVNTVTNGTIIGDKIDDIIKSPLNSISISLNAYDASGYKKINDGEQHQFEKVVKNIESLVKKRNSINGKICIKTSFICTRDNYKQMPKMIEFAESLGVDVLDFINIIPIGTPGFTKDKPLYNDDRDVVDFIKHIDTKSLKLTINMPKLLQRNVTIRSCKWYFENMSIDAEGNVGSCGAIIAPNKEYGNIFKNEDVWNNDHFQDMRKMFLNKSVPLCECCAHCVNNSK